MLTIKITLRLRSRLRLRLRYVYDYDYVTFMNKKKNCQIVQKSKEKVKRLQKSSKPFQANSNEVTEKPKRGRKKKVGSALTD